MRVKDAILIIRTYYKYTYSKLNLFTLPIFKVNNSVRIISVIAGKEIV